MKRLIALVLFLPVAVGYAAGDPAVVTAAKNDDLKAVRAELAKGANVNLPGSDGSSALLWAAYHSNVEMTRALIEIGRAHV